jgi:hypothetical protein
MIEYFVITKPFGMVAATIQGDINGIDKISHAIALR